jgi:hypothetical protein
MDSNRICGTHALYSVRGKVMMIALGCSLSVATWSQNIKIPDFRRPPPTIATFGPGKICEQCGRILSIREVTIGRPPVVPQTLPSSSPAMSSGPGGPNLVGAVVYLPLGGGKSERPFVGGVGTPEMQERFRESTYEIAIRLDDDTLRVIQRHDGPRYSVGDRVRLSGFDELELVAD